MNKFFLLFISLVVITGKINAQKTGETQVLKPSRFKQEVPIVVDNKARMYYFLSTEKTSLIFAQGPGKLRLITRAQFLPNQSRTVSYGIVYSLNGGTPVTLSAKSIERSTKASFSDPQYGKPGELHQFEINIPRGDNTISFQLADNNTPVAVRYLFNPVKEKKKEWIVYSPSLSQETVELVSNESVVSYYRFNQEKPLKIDVIGPTQIRVFTRIEFTHQMRGSVNYRLQVKNNGQIINTYQMSNKRSDIATYKNSCELVPGKASEFVIDVPAGNQTYEIIPLDKDKNSVLGRTLIIKKDVKNSSQ